MDVALETGTQEIVIYDDGSIDVETFISLSVYSLKPFL